MTIPKGVNVVMLEMHWISFKNMYDFSYVGVTPGKTYNTSNYKDWYYDANGTLDVLTGTNNMRLVISWSPTINEKSPHYTDY